MLRRLHQGRPGQLSQEGLQQGGLPGAHRAQHGHQLSHADAQRLGQMQGGGTAAGADVVLASVDMDDFFEKMRHRKWKNQEEKNNCTKCI